MSQVQHDSAHEYPVQGCDIAHEVIQQGPEAHVRKGTGTGPHVPWIAVLGDRTAAQSNTCSKNKSSELTVFHATSLSEPGADLNCNPCVNAESRYEPLSLLICVYADPLAPGSRDQVNLNVMKGRQNR